MAKFKSYKVRSNGEIPAIVKPYISLFDGQRLSNCPNLDSEIGFITCELRVAHGNTNADGSGWLCSLPKAENTWSISFEIA